MTALRNGLYIFQRELLSLFVSPLAYVVAALYLFIQGLVFVLTFERSGLAELRMLADPLGYLLPLLFSPLLTMRLLAEERRSGTLELIMTAPVTETQAILGKFLAVWFFFSLLCGLTLPHLLAMELMYSGSLDWSAIFVGYVGLLLTAGFFLALGLTLSGCFNQPTLSALTALAAGFAMLLAGFFLAQAQPATENMVDLQALGYYLMPFGHFKTLLNGLLDTRAIFYFVLSIGFFLYLSVKVLESRRWL